MVWGLLVWCKKIMVPTLCANILNMNDYQRVSTRPSSVQHSNRCRCILLLPGLLFPCDSSRLGKFEKLGYGFAVPGRLGWMLFETVQLVSFILSFALTPSPVTVSPESLPTRYTIASLFVVHYLHRAFIYPVKAHSLAPVRSDILFQSMGYNGLIGYLNGRTAGFVGSYTGDEMRDWTFWGAVSIFAVGMWINITSDYSMFELRRKRDSKKIDDKDVVVLDGRRYVLPRGFLWDYVAAPHYFGEIIEWTGFTLAARSPAALAFLVFTAANLIPRAMMAHQWYIEKFGARYPENRRAVFPFVL